MTTYAPFKVCECRHCGDPLLEGLVGGIRFRLDPAGVPARDAMTLLRYRVPVVRLERLSTGLWGDFYDPTVDIDPWFLLIDHGRKRERCS